jgi:hypothetical protein
LIDLREVEAANQLLYLETTVLQAVVEVGQSCAQMAGRVSSCFDFLRRVGTGWSGQQEV